MNTWQPSTEHRGYRTKTIKVGNCTVEILRPCLDREEQTKRENHLRNVAEATMKTYLLRKDTKQ